MSNLLTEPCIDVVPVLKQRSELEAAVLIGSGVIQLTGNTLSDILDGRRPINESCVVYDPSGRKVSTKLILDNLEIQ